VLIVKQVGHHNSLFSQLYIESFSFFDFISAKLTILLLIKVYSNFDLIAVLFVCENLSVLTKTRPSF